MATGKSYLSLFSASVFTTLVILISSNQLLVSSLNDSGDFLLTAMEKDTLEKFRPLVEPYMPEEVMKSDFYLIRWLRVTNFDILEARAMLLQAMRWRRDINATQLISEDWSDLADEYPMSFGGRDKQGRPVVEILMGDWDLRKAVMRGKIPRLSRYMVYSTERLFREILRVQMETRTRISRGVVLVDVDGFNLVQRSCPSCLAMLIQWTLAVERYYPLTTDEVIIVNAPPTVSVALNAIRPMMQQEAREKMQVFNAYKNEWVPYLDRRIARDQRTSRFVGSKCVEKIARTG